MAEAILAKAARKRGNGHVTAFRKSSTGDGIRELPTLSVSMKMKREHVLTQLHSVELVACHRGLGIYASRTWFTCESSVSINSSSSCHTF